MSSVPKRHHFLPKFYLEGFARDGSLWLYDRHRRQFRPGTPGKTAVIGHYYALETESGERDYSVEEFLSLVEGRAKEVILILERGGGNHHRATCASRLLYRTLDSAHAEVRARGAADILHAV